MLSILKNEEIIAINQDPVVGTAVSPFRWGINVRLPFSTFVCVVYQSASYKPDWVSNSTHPAQYWSGESQNGTIFMLVSIHTLVRHSMASHILITRTQINTLDEPADMFFSLTESPWIRAGRQYSVRVSSASAPVCPPQLTLS